MSEDSNKSLSLHKVPQKSEKHNTLCHITKKSINAGIIYSFYDTHKAMTKHNPMLFYFAYGSNMNPARMVERGLKIADIFSGWVDGFALRFNKRSRRDALLACANMVFSQGERIEGVLYQLESMIEIGKLDSHEGTPYFYSREIFPIQTKQGPKPAWTYVANPAVIDNTIKPARWYVEHLLAGRDYLTEAYYAAIDRTVCREAVEVRW